MISEYISIFKNYTWAVFTLGLAYGATIVFTFFGPVMLKAAGLFAQGLSLVAVACHILGFYLPPFRWEANGRYLKFMGAVLLPLVMGFSFYPIPGQVLITLCFAWMIGRVGCFWTYRAQALIPQAIRGKVIAGSLFISFLLLYLVNMGLPLLTPLQAMGIPALIGCFTLICHGRMGKKGSPGHREEKSLRGQEPPYFSFLLVVYVAGGMTYAGIYPYFLPYAQIDRYYNVLFYVLSVGLAGWVMDTLGRKTVFSIGVVLLGISFAFFLMLGDWVTYLMTQTFLQAGWAFVNLFGWRFSWDMALETGNPYHFPRGIAAMLLGASLGAFLSHVFQVWGAVHQFIYGISTFIPLVLAMVWLFFFPENQDEERKRQNR